MIPAEKSNEICELCEHETGLRPRTGVPSAPLTTYYIGGPIGYLLEPSSTEDLAKGIKFLKSLGERYRVLGGGSNLLIASAGLSGWVIRPGRGFRFARDLDDGRFEAGAVMSLMNLSRELSRRGFTGLEFAGGIPASIGGAVRMNAGAHGGQISDVLESVVLVDPEGEVREVGASELHFSYRKSGIPDGAVVASVRLRLKPCVPDESAARRNHFLNERKKAQPLTAPSAGSVFKNPSPDCSAGRLIESVHLKGTRRGGAMISEKHANWIVNVERRATSSDVLELIALCKERVRDAHGIQLEQEVIYWE